jgi:hypothetical protein
VKLPRRREKDREERRKGGERREKQLSTRARQDGIDDGG